MRSVIKNIFLLICFLAFSARSQNQTSKWYFGSQAGLDFMGAPTVLTNGMCNPWEGCASIANGAGTLLFYTDGITIWNSTHAVMANGSGLFGNSSSTQSGVIVKQPGNANIYYVFTVDAQGGANGLCYSIVNMSLAGGLGSVTVKNSLLYTPSSEKITSVRACNGTDIWVVTHDWNSNNFRSYLLTAGGLGAAVLSAVGPVHTGNSGNAIGSMKASANGRKLCLCMQYAPFDTFHLCDFNNATGAVSNLIDLGTGLYVWPYGIEFSQDGTKLYGGKYGGGVYSITQWNACAGGSVAILASAFTVSTNLVAMPFYFQMAPNGKIYVCRYQQSVDGVINSPNSAGAGCNYVDLGQSTAPRINNLGLPNFVASYLKPPPTPYTYTTNPALVTCLTASFFAPPGPTVNCSSSNYSVTGYNWNFGDPPSGILNVSNLANPIHAYPSSGTYSVTLITNFTCGADTVLIPVVINPCTNLPIELKSFESTCMGNAIEINWETNSERNNSKFMVSRSVNGTNYSFIAEIAGSGSTSEGKKYSIVDREVSKDKIYTYRLTQIDADKSEKVFNSYPIIRCERKDAEVDIFPVPSGKEISIVTSENLSEAEITIVNAVGEKLITLQKGSFEKGIANTVDISSLPDGYYYLIITKPGKQIQKKVIVQK
jgi:PKD repeat protein